MPAQSYTREIRRKLKYFAAWEPGIPLSVGTIGSFKDSVFRPIDHLDNLGISIKIEKTPHDSGTISYKSDGGISIQKKLEGDLPIEGSGLAIADVGFSVKFEKEKLVLFEVSGLTRSRISDQIRLGEEIESLYKTGKWEKPWVIITELVHAKEATIAVSKSRSASFDLKAKAEIGKGALQFANLGSDFGISGEKNMEVSFSTDQGCTPLFRLSGIKKIPFLPGNFVPKGEELERSDEEGVEEFGLINIEED